MRRNHVLIFTGLILLAIFLIAPFYTTNQLNKTKQVTVNTPISPPPHPINSGNPAKIEPKWELELPRGKIVDIIYGDYIQNDSTKEVALIYDNDTVAIVNFTETGGIGQVLGYLKYNSADTSIIKGERYFMKPYYNAGKIELWNTTSDFNITLPNAFTDVDYGDVDGDGSTDIVAINSTQIHVYLTTNHGVVERVITTNDIGITANSIVFDKEIQLYRLDKIEDKGLLINFVIEADIGVLLIYDVNIWINETVYKYYSWYLNVQSVYTNYIFHFVTDARFDDTYYTVALQFNSSGTIIIEFYHASYQFTSYNTSQNANYFSTISFSNTLTDKVVMKLRDYNESLSYGEYAIVPYISGTRTYLVMFYSVNNSGTIQMSYTLLTGFTIPSTYSIGLVDVNYKDRVDDILIPHPGTRRITEIPGSYLRAGTYKQYTIETILTCYSLATMNLTKDLFDEIITGEDGYLMMYKTPGMSPLYFDGKPAGPVVILKKYDINNDGSDDFLMVYNDTDTGIQYLYYYITDIKPPQINEISYAPKKPTAIDSITVTLKVTDNTKVNYVSGYYLVYLYDKKLIDHPVFFTKEADGVTYKVTLEAPQFYDYLADYKSYLFISAVDIFENKNSTFLMFDLNSNIDQDTYFRPAGEDIKNIYVIKQWDIDRDNKSEIYYAINTTEPDVNGNDAFVFLADYSNRHLVNVSYGVNSTVYGEPVDIIYMNDTDGNPRIIFVTNLLIGVLDPMLNQTYNLTVSDPIISSRISDINNDGYNELLLSFANGTISAYRVSPTSLIKVNSYNVEYIAADFIKIGDYIYYISLNDTTGYVNVTALNIIDLSSTRIFTFKNENVSYTNNYRMLAVLNGKALLALKNGSIYNFDINGYEKLNIPNKLSGIPGTTSYIVKNNTLYVGDETGEVYVINTQLQITNNIRVIYGALPYSLDAGDINNDGKTDVVVEYIEQFLNLINFDNGQITSYSTDTHFKIMVGDFDNSTADEIFMVGPPGVVLAHDLAKYYSLNIDFGKPSNEYVQGEHISAYVDIHDIFGDPITKAEITAIFYRPDGSKVVQTFVNFNNGTYKLRLPLVNWAYGYTNMTILVHHNYYNDYSYNASFLVRPILNLIVDDEIEASHGSNCTIRLDVRDINDFKVYNASGYIQVNGIRKNIGFDPQTGYYEAIITADELKTLTMGEYNMTINVYHPLALENATANVTLVVYSSLNISITVNPGIIVQGENFTVTTQVIDQSGAVITDAYIDVYIDNEYFDSGYTVSVNTSYWEGGNHSITVYVTHDYALGMYFNSSYIIVLSQPIMEISFENDSVGVAKFYIELYDKYWNTLSDGKLVMSVLGKNYTINGTASFRFKFNFTKLAPQSVFNVTFYLVNGSYTLESKLGTYTIRVLISGKITFNYEEQYSHSEIIYQGNGVRLTANITDMFGNKLVGLSEVYIYISGVSYQLREVSPGVYSVVFPTDGWAYGMYLFEIIAYNDTFYGGQIEVSGNILILPRIQLKGSYTTFNNLTTIAYFTITDRYGYLISNYNFSILETNLTLLSYSADSGALALVLSSIDMGPGLYILKLNVSWVHDLTGVGTWEVFDLKVPMVTTITSEDVNVTAPGLAANTNDYPANAIVQGNNLYINVTIVDDFGNPITRARVRLIFAGVVYSPSEKIGNLYMFTIPTEKLASGHYIVIIQISGQNLYVGNGDVLEVTKVIYIKPEIHYEVIMPENIQEGQNFTVIIRVTDKYGNPLPPIENKTRIYVRVGDKTYVAKYDEQQKVYVAQVSAPPVGETEVQHSYGIQVIVDYEGTNQPTIEQEEIVVNATPPISNTAISTNINWVSALTIGLTVIALVGYLIVRFNMFNEKLIRWLYSIVMFGNIALVIVALLLAAIHEYGYAEILVLTAFIGIFPWYGLQVRLDQIRMFKHAFKSMIEDKKPEIEVNPIPYIFIYAFGAVTILLAFEVIGPGMIWFSRYVLGGFKVGPIHYITAQTLVFYLFAARGIFIKTVRHLKDVAENKLPTILYAESLESRMTLFTNIVEDSIKLIGSYVITTTIYTLYLLATSIWGTSRLPMINLDPTVLGLILLPLTLPIVVIWLLQYIKLPWERGIEKLTLIGE